MNRYIGTYEWVKDENFDKALEEKVWPILMKNMIANNRPTTLTIKDNGDGTYGYESECGANKVSKTFKLGVPFESDAGGIKNETVFTIWDNKLVHRCKMPDVALDYTSFFLPRDGDMIIMSIEAHGIVGKRYFKAKAE